MSFRLSIILPVKDQADHLEQILEDYIGVVSNLYEFEILVIVNSSQDRSFEIAQGVATQHKQIRVFQFPWSGWGRAVREGVALATGDLICFTNSARTRPAEIIDFVDLAIKNPEVLVKAVRQRDVSLIRLAGSLLYKLINKLLFNVAIEDINGTPKLMSRETYAKIAPRELGDLIDLEIVSQCVAKGIPILQLPLKNTKRFGGLSTTSWKSAIRMYTGSFSLWLRKKS